MKINGIDLTHKYEEIRIGQETIKERKVVSFVNWIDQADAPIILEKPKGKFYDVEVEMIVSGNTKTEAEMLMSNIQADCLSGEIELDTVDFILQGELKGVEKEFISRWKYKLNLTFQAWDKTEKETSVSFTGTEKKIFVEGNLETPCIIELTPINDTISFTIQGAARNPVTGQPEDITIKNLKQGKKVIIDGEACTVLQGVTNKFADADMWEFPSLLPGNNTLTFSSALCEVTIKYKPRYF